MKYKRLSDDFTRATLKRPQSPHSLRLFRLMEEQQREEIAERLRGLRNGSKESNDSIADYVGVRGRSVAGWMRAEHGPTYEHIVKVGELFDVDPDWLWSGRVKGATPDLAISERLDAIQEGIEELLRLVGPLAGAQVLDDADQAIPGSRSRTSQARASNAKSRPAAKRRAGSQ